MGDCLREWKKTKAINDDISLKENQVSLFKLNYDLYIVVLCYYHNKEEYQIRA